MRDRHHQHGERNIHPGKPHSVWRQFLEAGLSLKWKATILVVVLTISVTSVVAGFVFRAGFASNAVNPGPRAIQVAMKLVGEAAPFVEGGKLSALSALATETANGKPLHYVAFFNLAGECLASAGSGGNDVPASISSEPLPSSGSSGDFETLRQSESRGDMWHITYPIHGYASADTSNKARSLRLLGYVRVGAETADTAPTMISQFDLLISVGLLAAVLAIPVGFVLIRKLVAPLEGLAEAMVAFSHGDLQVRSQVTRDDEIGRLCSAFNRMADQHEQTHERTVRLNANLEERVARRTQQLRELAARDPLTGLYNRRHFNEVTDRAFAEASRYGSELSCIMIDLDEFKAANDEHGHQVGDELLVLTASTISSQLRSSDVPARYGGDEFIVMLPQTGLDRAHILAERIVEKFTREMAQRFPLLRVTLSVGIASLKQTADGTDAESFLRATDRALYQAKERGRNRIAVADSPPPASPEPASV